MAITINKRALFGGGAIFTSDTAETVAQAIKEMGYRPYLRGADLTGADLRGADLTGADLTGAYLRGAYLRGADLTGAYAPWGSHDFIAEALRQSAENDVQKRMVAGMILVSRDWCWKEFAALDIAPELRDWAFRTLSAWAWVDDTNVPRQFAEWMKQNGVDRPVRPVSEVSA